MLAAAKVNPGGFFGRKRNRLKARTLVRTVAVRLVLAAPTAAPVVGLTGFDVDGIGLFLCDYSFLSHHY